MNNILPFNRTSLETERLLLRPISLNDLEAMYNNWASDPLVTKHLSWDTHRSIEDTRRVITSWLLMYEKPFFFQWAIEIKATKELIGTISLFDIKHDLNQGEIGYCLGRAFWNHGYATEALKAVIKYAFMENGFNSLVATHLIENPASGRVMEKCGMKYDYDFIKPNCKINQSGRLKSYLITKAMWINQNKH